MIERLRRLWRDFWLRWAARHVERVGYRLVDADSLEEARDVLFECRRYVDRSGHLNTVSGRRPRAVRRVVRSLDRITVLTVPEQEVT